MDDELGVPGKFHSIYTEKIIFKLKNAKQNTNKTKYKINCNSE